jgi:hypothetical protein
MLRFSHILGIVIVDLQRLLGSRFFGRDYHDLTISLQSSRFCILVYRATASAGAGALSG